MLYAAVGECNKAETGMIRLNLNSIQQEIMLGELQAFNEREAIEDANIAAHQVATTNVLLTGGRKATRQDAFKSLLQTHLYKDLDRQDDVATRRQVNDARAYMASCGLDTSFLDSWQSPLAPAYTVTESDDEIDAKYPLSVSLREVMAAENAIKSTAVPCVMTPISLEPSPPPVMTKTPVQQTQNRQTPVAQPTQPASPITPPSVVDVLPLNSPTSHYSTGETTQVIADTQYTYPFGSAAPSQSLSTPRNPDPQLHAHPQTPLPPDVQYSNLPRTPEPSATPRALPWPGTPPTPSHVTLPLPETIDSDYAPKPKKQRPSASKKNSMTRKTVDQSPGSVSGTPKKVPVSLTGSSPQDEEARPSSQVTQSSPGPAEMESSSAQTDSTIAVQIPGQQSTLAAQLGLGTTNGPSSGTNPKKGKAGRGRGRPRKSQG